MAKITSRSLIFIFTSTGWSGTNRQTFNWGNDPSIVWDSCNTVATTVHEKKNYYYNSYDNNYKKNNKKWELITQLAYSGTVYTLQKSSRWHFIWVFLVVLWKVLWLNATLSSSLTLHIKCKVECKIYTFHVMF